MPFIPRPPHWPDPRVKPPFRAAEIDWGHPLAMGLTNLWLMQGEGRILDAVGQSHASITFPSVSYGMTAQGVGLIGVLTIDGRNVTISPAVTLLINNAFTHRVRLLFTASDGFGAVFTAGNASGLFARSTGGYQWYSGALGGTTMTAGRWYEIVSSRPAGSSTISYYVNGVADGTATFNATQSIDTMFSDVSSETFAGQILFQQVWNRQLSATEVAYMYAEPYAMLRPVMQNVFYSFPRGAAVAAAASVVKPRSLALLGVGT